MKTTLLPWLRRALQPDSLPYVILVVLCATSLLSRLWLTW